MRAVVLGGAGVVGAETVRDLVNSEIFEEVVVADYNLKKAGEVAEKFKGKKTAVSAVFVDANNHDSLVKVMKDADIAASTIGPFYKYGSKVLKGALDAGVNFVDIDDDQDATEEALGFNEEFEKAGTTAIIGLGGSPGVSNIIAKYGANKLDLVDEIRIVWVQSIAEPGGSAPVDHWIHCITGTIPIYREGRWVDVPARSESEIIDFGPPVGKARVYLCGHGEPVTLPRYIKGVKTVTNKAGLVPSWVMDLFDYLIDFGFFSTGTLHVNDVSLSPRDFTLMFLQMFPEFASAGTLERIEEDLARMPRGEGITEVIGKKDGETTRLTYWITGPDELLSADIGTSRPLSLGVQMLAKGDIKVKGVFAPEGCIEPRPFLTELKKIGIEIHEREERTRELSF